MTLDWGEADPAHFLGVITGWTVAINGTDATVADVSRTGLTLADGRQLSWEEVGSLYIY